MAAADPGSVDALIVGAGHNGLVCACYLAAAGLRVRMLEKRPVVGGAAVTEEFTPGFRNSTASYTVSLLNPDPRSAPRRARARHQGAPVLELRAAGRSLQFGGDTDVTQREDRRRASTNCP